MRTPRSRELAVQLAKRLGSRVVDVGDGARVQAQPSDAGLVTGQSCRTSSAKWFAFA